MSMLLPSAGTNLFAGTMTAASFFPPTTAQAGLRSIRLDEHCCHCSCRHLARISLPGLVRGVFLSTNNGTSWTAVNTGLTNTACPALAVSGTNLFAGTEGGVFLSTNNGTNWTAVNAGLTDQSLPALAVSGTNLFAGTE